MVIKLSIFIVIVILIFFVLCFVRNKSEFFVTNDDFNYDSLNGPYDYSQNPLLDNSKNSNQGMGTDSDYSFEGPYEDNPL